MTMDVVNRKKEAEVEQVKTDYKALYEQQRSIEDKLQKKCAKYLLIINGLNALLDEYKEQMDRMALELQSHNTSSPISPE